MDAVSRRFEKRLRTFQMALAVGSMVHPFTAETQSWQYP